MHKNEEQTWNEYSDIFIFVYLASGSLFIKEIVA